MGAMQASKLHSKQAHRARTALNQKPLTRLYICSLE
jgi:hypothetical protein